MDINGIVLNKAFADDDSEVTNNFIAQLAYLLSEEICLNSGNGVVLTSNILAEDQHMPLT